MTDEQLDSLEDRIDDGLLSSWDEQDLINEVRRLKAINANLLEACKGLLMCSLPRDISGQRHVENARAAIAIATGEADGI